MGRTFRVIMIAAILSVGLFLRYHNLNVWPREGATFDEYAWTFLGLSILEKGIPTSWSPHPQYAHKVYYQNPHGASFFLATPYLEHPPLFGLVAGGYAYLIGIRSFDGVTVRAVRPLALALGVVSIVLVYLLAAEVFGSGTGLVSAFLYAITPTVVNGSKLVQNENFFIPMMLFAIYGSLRMMKHPHSRFCYVVFPVLFLLPMAKVPWIAAAAAVAGILFFGRKWRQGIFAVTAGLGGIAVYLVWGAYWNWDLFVRLMSLQLGRYDLGYASIVALVTDPIVTDRLFVDGVIYAGWAAVCILLVRDLKKIFPVVAGFLSYLFVYLFAIPNEPGHGWYRYPLYPFLIISLAKVLSDVFNKNFVLTSLFLLIIGLPGMEHVLQPLIGFSFPIYRLFLAAVSIGALPVLFRDRRITALSRSVNIFLLVLVLGMTVFSAAGYTEQ